MGGSRDWCWHCSVSLPYTHGARRAHTLGSEHVARVNAHYARVSARLQLTRAASRPVCRRWRDTRACQWGDACRNSHLSGEEFDHLTRRADEERVAEEYGPAPPRRLVLADQQLVDLFLAGLPAVPGAPAAL